MSPEEKTKWTRNLRLFLVFMALISALVNVPLNLPYYQSLGLGIAEFGWIFTLNTVVIMLCGIPAAYMADRISCRRMLLIGVGIQAACYVGLAVNYWHWMAYVIQALLGIGQAAVGGAVVALARKSTDILGDTFERYTGRGVAMAGLAEAGASVIALLLALKLGAEAPRAAMAVQAIVFTGLLLVPYRMYEGDAKTKNAVSLTLRSLAQATRTGVRQLISDVRQELRIRTTRWVVLSGAALGCAPFTVINLSQAYFQAVQISPVGITVCWTVYHVVWAAFSLGAAQYVGWFRSREDALRSLVWIGAVINLLMTFATGWWGLAVMAGFFFLRGIQMPIFMNYVTEVAGENTRATLSSVQATIQGAMYAAMNGALGLVSEYASVQWAFALSLGVYLILGLWCLNRLRQAKAARQLTSV